MAKVNEELINKVKQAQSEIHEIQLALGAIALAELQKQDMYARYKELQGKINEATESIKSTLGDGTVDLATGEFHPAEAKQAENPSPESIAQMTIQK
jgi:DNA-binding ferritin-like protein